MRLLASLLISQFLEGEDDLEGSDAEGGEEEPKEEEDKAKDEL